MKEELLNAFEKNKKTYHAFRERITNLLTDLLIEQNIRIHQINGRTKTLKSLSKKIDDKGEKYNKIDDITDIVGIRVISYLESDVDAIADLIEKEFIVDEKNSIDKRKLKTDQFGYRSLHIVASLSSDRCLLKEYSRYRNIKCEIQVRSILQHAWAEIEHDLGYKGEVSIPDRYKRTFNRLSALLETADIEFDRLKWDLTKYESEIPSLITSDPELVDINKASINSFITTNPILLKAKAIIESKTKIILTGDGLIDIVIRRIKGLNFQTIGEIERALIEDKEEYLNFVKIFVDNKISEGRTVVSVAPLMYFMHYYVTKLKDKQLFETYFEITENSNIDDKDFSDYKKMVTEAVKLSRQVKK